MIVSVHQPQYVPWLGYFNKIIKSDYFVFLDKVQYKNREFQNRNKIRTQNGWMWLTVPVISKGLGRQAICDVAIDNSFEWRKRHWRSLLICYQKSPFFKEHSDFFEKVYLSKWNKLAELNVYIIKYIMEVLGINTPFCFESDMNISTQKTDRIVDICLKLNADSYLSGIGGKSYLEEKKFEGAEIKLLYQDFRHPVYRQQFVSNEEDFLPCMSLIDLLFNEGPKSRGFLEGKI